MIFALIPLDLNGQDLDIGHFIIQEFDQASQLLGNPIGHEYQTYLAVSKIIGYFLPETFDIGCIILHKAPNLVVKQPIAAVGCLCRGCRRELMPQ